MKAFFQLQAVAMRAEPTDRAEMTNQMLYGDTAEVVERKEKWSLVKAHYDGYIGWVDNKQYIPYESACGLAMTHYIGSPYLWGGRTAAGIDCSGLTQVCFKAMDIWLPRDASQQVTTGTEQCFCDIRTDDLAFFSNQAGKIIHVGICMGDGRIIHSSGCVRVDILDRQGILNSNTGEYSHTLHSIRRVR